MERQKIDFVPPGHVSAIATSEIKECHPVSISTNEAGKITAALVPVELVTNVAGIGLTVQGICDELNRVTKQRDELLSALIYHQEQTRPIQQSIDAIANAK